MALERWRSACAALILGIFALVSFAIASPKAKAVPAPADFYGISTPGQLENAHESVGIERLGIHNVRANIVWNLIEKPVKPCDGVTEPSPSSPDWTLYDKRFRQAAEHGITVIGTLYGSLCNNYFPVPNTPLYNAYVSKPSDGYEGFIWKVVQRYGVNGDFWQKEPNLPYHPVRIWEIWNEPNLPANNPGGEAPGGGGEVFEQAYAKFLIDSATAVRKAQEAKAGQPYTAVGTKVLLGGLYSGGGQTVTQFFNEIYSLPSGYTPSEFHNSFDGLSYHPYAISGSEAKGTLAFGVPNDAVNHVKTARSVLDQPRSALGGGSDANKTLWITEVGWPTEFVPFAWITPQIQSEYLVQTLNWMYVNAGIYKIEYAAWFTYENYAPCSQPKCWDRYSGLRLAGEESTTRPSWCAYMELIGVKACAPNLRGILMNGTGSKKTEVHLLDGATGYSRFVSQTQSGLGETTTPQWQFSCSDFNGDGVGDLIGILMNGTGSKKTEVHIFSGTNYSTPLGSFATAFSETTPSQWQFTTSDVNKDGKADLFGILMNGTGSKKTEVHILSGASNFTTSLGSYATSFSETTASRWRFSPADVNQDGKVDLVGILMNGTGSKKTEVHILSGASNFTTSLGDYATALDETTPSQWQLSARDVNKDGKVDLFGVQMNGTGSKKTEVHSLSGATNYSTFLAHDITKLGETTASQWAFALPVP